MCRVFLEYCPRGANIRNLDSKRLKIVRYVSKFYTHNLGDGGMFGCVCVGVCVCVCVPCFIFGLSLMGGELLVWC